MCYPSQSQARAKSAKLIKCMKEFDKEKLLIAPDLRDSSTGVIAE